MCTEAIIMPEKPTFGTMTKTIDALEIIDIADEGRGIGKWEGRAVFVKHVVPGDIVEVEVKRKKNKFIEASVKEYKSYSPFRIKPECRHFGVCGGCKRQDMTYEKQLFYKQKQVKDALERIAHVENPAIENILASKSIFHYRNRLDFAFSDKEWMTSEQVQNPEYVSQPALGFHVTGRFDKVLNITECLLQEDLSNKIRNFVREYALKHNYTFFNRINQHGMLRNMIVRNTTKGQWMVAIMFKDATQPEREQLLKAVAEKFPQITSLYSVVNPKKNDTFFDLEFELFSGTPFITEEMEGLNFQIGPKTFYQTNPVQAYELYKTAREFAELSKDDHVYDLYTGTGTIAAFIASQCKYVTGIESVAESIENAKINSQLNHISNTSFFAGDMREILTNGFYSQQGFPDVIITDPPRAGMHPDVVKVICNSGARRVVYVSCNVATQARDIALMKEHYRFIKCRPVDMFPQTDHVENVALLEKI